MKKIIITIVGALLFVGTIAGENIKQLSDWSNAQAVGFNLWTLFCLIGIPYIIFLQFKDKFKKKSEKPVIEVKKEASIAEDKTISYLERKVWYRTLKVFYAMFFLIICIFSNIIIFDNIPNEPVPINKTVGVISDELILSPERRKQLDSIVVKMANQNATQREAQIIVDDFTRKFGLPKKTSFDFESFGTEVSQSQKQPQPSNVVWYFIIGNLSILLFFEVLRRIFYYIILGSLRPQK